MVCSFIFFVVAFRLIFEFWFAIISHKSANRWQVSERERNQVLMVTERQLVVTFNKISLFMYAIERLWKIERLRSQPFNALTTTKRNKKNKSSFSIWIFWFEFKWFFCLRINSVNVLYFFLSNEFILLWKLISCCRDRNNSHLLLELWHILIYECIKQYEKQ